jgi:hypothetical protein
LEADSISFGVEEEGHVAVLVVARLRQYDLAAGGSNAIEDSVQVVAAVEVHDGSVARRLAAAALYETSTAVLLLRREPLHHDVRWGVEMREFNVKDRAVELAGAFDVIDRNVEPVDELLSSTEDFSCVRRCRHFLMGFGLKPWAYR